MMLKSVPFSIFVIMLVLILGSGQAEIVIMPNYLIDKGQITVSGVSAGAFMSIQLHVAHSATIRGAGSIAGAVYNCANGNETVGYDICCYAKETFDMEALYERTAKWEASDEIDSTKNLNKAPVYIFWGTADDLVYYPPSQWAQTFYEKFGADVTMDNQIPAAHAFVTDFYGNECSAKGPPGIVNCGWDLAGKMLQKFYGPLKPRVKPSMSLSGYLIEFDQRDFFADMNKAYGLDVSGWLYVPKSCSTKKVACKLHVVLHGCRQGATNPLFGLNIVLNTGYNYWADTNDIVVLYPQAGNNEFNSNWCFDWAGDGLGFDSSKDYSTKSGKQIQALIAMINHVTSYDSSSSASALLMRRQHCWISMFCLIGLLLAL